jgi:hypothetical protein
VRAAILILFAAVGLVAFGARADDSFSAVTTPPSSHPGYIVSEKYATAHKADLVASLPGEPKIDGFWTPTEQNVAVAERVFRELIHNAAKDPALLFPDLAEATDADSIAALKNEKIELGLVDANYEAYLRQYVGVIIDANKVILCNYSDAPKINPATDYIFIQKVFTSDGTLHFLQCRFDSSAKTCSNVSIIGSWQPPAKSP